jgi:hypothetical protein
VLYNSGSYLTSSLNINYPLFTENIKSFNFENDYFTFITQYSSLSSYINTLKGYGGSYYGSDMTEYDITYDDKLNNFYFSGLTQSVTQFMGIVDRDFNFNIFPLKTKTSIDDTTLGRNYKEYQKTYVVNDDIFAQFKINEMPVRVNPDEYTMLFNSYDVLSSYINDYGFIADGAIGGNCPLNSDIIVFNQTEYERYSNDGTDNVNVPNNGTLLCLWLSAQNPDANSAKIWTERWYDPNTTTQQNAYISQKNTPDTSFTHIVDIPSQKIFSENEKLTYLRYGPARNQGFVDSLSANLLLFFNKWDQQFTSSVNEISGFVVGNYPAQTDDLILDGTDHAHVPPEDIILNQSDITVGLWANTSDWSFNNDAQFFGNYYNGTGYGIEYNNGTPSNLISLPTISDNLFAMNDRGFKVFEKDLKDDLGLSGMSIDYIKTDLFGNRWLYDSYNNNIYKIENDDLVITTVNLPISSEIVKMECDSNNSLFVLDNATHHISSFDFSGTYLNTTVLSSYHNNFEITNTDNLVYANAEFLTVNSTDKIVKMVGPTLIIDDKKVLYLTDKPHSIRLDLDDNIWILLKNSIIKTDKTGNIIFNYSLDTFFVPDTAEMCFVKTNKNGYDEINLWIIYNESRYVLVINSEGKIKKRIDLSRLFVGNQCKDFQLGIKGDFTGFDNKRKFDRLNGLPISPTHPAISLKLGLSCGNNHRLVNLHTSPKYLTNWCHLAFSVESSYNLTSIKFYVNGDLVEQKNVAGNYSINYGYKSSPFIIGGNSGKLGAKNLEKSIINTGFFRGEIADIRLYDRVLNNFEMLNLSLNNHYDKWSHITFYVKCPPTTMLEEMDTFHINRYKGFKSNYFNVVVKNLTDNEDLKTIISDYIKANIAQFIPANTILNTIKFE